MKQIPITSDLGFALTPLADKLEKVGIELRYQESEPTTDCPECGCEDYDTVRDDDTGPLLLSCDECGAVYTPEPAWCGVQSGDVDGQDEPHEHYEIWVEE